MLAKPSVQMSIHSDWRASEVGETPELSASKVRLCFGRRYFLSKQPSHLFGQFSDPHQLNAMLTRLFWWIVDAHNTPKSRLGRN